MGMPTDKRFRVRALARQAYSGLTWKEDFMHTHAEPVVGVDAYVHCGLSKYKPLEELDDAMTRANVSRAVIVQHLGEFDNSYIQSIVADRPERFAGVCLVDWDDPDASSHLERQHQTGRFKGVRLTLESLERNRKLWDRAAELGMHFTLYSLESFTLRLDMLRSFIEQNPGATFILSHLAMSHLAPPDLINDPQMHKQQRMLELAACPNVVMQLSGFHMFCESPHAPLWPFVKLAVDTFGPDRLLWGSNYPVCEQYHDYVQEVEIIRSGMDKSVGPSLAALCSANALKLWFDK